MSTLSEIDAKFQAAALAEKREAAECLYESLYDSTTDFMKLQKIETHLKRMEDEKELLEFLKEQVEAGLHPTDKDRLARIRGAHDTGSHNRFNEPRDSPRARRF